MVFAENGHCIGVAGTMGLRLGAAGAALVAVLAGFLLGRTTAAGAKAVPGLTPVSSSAAALALPQLSQAAPLPALRARAARTPVQSGLPPTVATTPGIVTVSVPVVTAPPPSKSKKHQTPVPIGGSG